MNDAQLVNMAAQITKRFLATQTVEADKLPDLISGIFNSLYEAQNPSPKVEPEVTRAKRKYTRRSQGQAVAEQQEEQQETASEESRSTHPDWRNDDDWDEHGQPKASARPEPDFD